MNVRLIVWKKEEWISRKMNGTSRRVEESLETIVLVKFSGLQKLVKW